MTNSTVSQVYDHFPRGELTVAEGVVAATTRWVGLAAMLFAVVFMLLMLARPVMADETMQRGDLVRILTDRYAELPTGRGLTADGQMLEVLSTEDGATWTIILTRPDGSSRVISAGQAWMPVTVALGPDV